MSYLFVYGTLMPEEVNHHHVSFISGYWYRASIKGLLFPNGIGKALGYPALILSEQGDNIHGYVLHSNELTQNWLALDQFEGDAYRRVQTQVVLENQQVVNAYVYVLAEAISNE